jgi:1,4-dihydroxy-6-naphthoate synthase
MNSFTSPLSLGYSPCPNDTFIFYALVHGRIDTAGLRFREVLLDVETLNQKALRGDLDLTKVSFHAYGYLRETYDLLASGAALGRGCGPLLVAACPVPAAALKGKRIAIPGRMTTAFLLLRLFDPALAENVVVMPFHEIVGAVQERRVDAGLIIHESRFTYQGYGLVEVEDLGRWWEGETGLPIPLGCILARKDLGAETIRLADGLIRQSLEYAYGHEKETRAYIKRHAQELADHVIDQHISLYVNTFSLDLGEEGRRAVAELFHRADKQGIFSHAARP